MYVEAKNKDIFIYLLLTLKIDCEMQSFALVFFLTYLEMFLYQNIELP